MAHKAVQLCGTRGEGARCTGQLPSEVIRTGMDPATVGCTWPDNENAVRYHNEAYCRRLMRKPIHLSARITYPAFYESRGSIASALQADGMRNRFHVFSRVVPLPTLCRCRR